MAHAASFQRRIIGRVQEDRFNFFYQFAALLRSLLDSLPIRVSPKILPALGRGFRAGKCEQINELSLRLPSIGWIPKADDRHVVFLEEFAGVVAEASLQRF